MSDARDEGDTNPRRPSRRRRGRLVLLLAAVALGGVGIFAWLERDALLRRYTTWVVLRDARSLAAERGVRPEEDVSRTESTPRASPPPFDGSVLRRALEDFVEDHREAFRDGRIDCGRVLAQAPRDLTRREALPAVVTIFADAMVVTEEMYRTARNGSPERPPLWGFLMRWLLPALRAPRPKEQLVHLLTQDWDVLPGPLIDGHAAGGVGKRVVLGQLLMESMPQDLLPAHVTTTTGRPWQDTVTVGMREDARPADWHALLRDTRHERDAVRAGAFLLLPLHPEWDRVRSRATDASADTEEAPLVRIAAAAGLAFRDDPAGRDVLAEEGLEHARWEIRETCAFILFRLRDPELAELLTKRMSAEADPWVRRSLQWMDGAIGDGPWPRDAGR